MGAWPNLRKNAFQWTEAATKAFKSLQYVLSSAPVFALPNFSKTFIMETDACGVVIGAVLMQEGQPIAFFRKALAPKHLNLSIYEKELLAVVLAVEHWHQCLERNKFIIRTDQQSLMYLFGQQLKTPFQMHWVAKLNGYDYEIHYKKGNNNAAADALSRMPRQQSMPITLSTSPPELLHKIKDSWENDDFTISLIPMAQQGGGNWGHFVWMVIFYNGRVNW